MSAEIKEFLSKENLVEYHQIIKDKIDDMTPSNIGVFVDKDEWVLNEEKGKYFNAIPIPGIDESCYPVIGIAPADGESPTEEEIDAYDHITDIITTEGYLTLWCTVEPTTSITIVIKDDLATGGTLIANYSAMVDKINKLETKISELTNNLLKVTSKYSGMRSINPGEKASFQLESSASYIITVMRVDESIAGNTDGINQSSFIATTTSNRASLCAIHNNSGIATSVVNRTVTLNNSISGYILQYTVVKLN